MQLNEIALQCRMISLESANPTQSLEAMSFRLPNVFSGISEFFKGIFTEREIPLNKVDPKPVMRLLQNKQYHEMADRTVFVPAGMSSSYSEYVLYLVGIQDVLTNTLLSKLEEYNKWIGTLLTKPELLASLNPAKVLFSDELGYLDALYVKGGEYMANGNVSERPFGEVFARNGEWVILCNAVNSTVERLGKIDRVRVMRHLEDLNVMLTTFTTRIKEDPATYKLSGPQLEALSTTTYNLGRMVEAYSIQTYALAAMVKALNDTSDWLVSGK